MLFVVVVVVVVVFVLSGFFSQIFTIYMTAGEWGRLVLIPFISIPLVSKTVGSFFMVGGLNKNAGHHG